MTRRAMNRCLRASSILVVGALLAGIAARAESPSVSAADFRASVTQMQGLVAACTKDAAACDAKKVAPDAIVGDTSKPGGFAVDWGWLRAAVEKAHDASPEERTSLMHDVGTRLEETATEIGVASKNDAFAKVRAQANAVLAGKEFDNGIAPPSLWDRMMARIDRFLGRLFNGIVSAGALFPWFWTAVEYLLIVAAAGGLAFFVLRSLSQQKMRVALNGSDVIANAWAIESEDWARIAETCAANGEWREAVHGLYWAAIILLESRRAWRHNPSRTPREYVRLLKPGSAQRDALRGLTQIFERVWYGFEGADAVEYLRARDMFEGLSRVGASAEVAG